MDAITILMRGTDGNGGLNRWEGNTPYPYLDAREIDGSPAPLVTVGRGCAFGPASCATAPPEFLGLRWYIDSNLATMHEIAADYVALCRLEGGYPATHYEQATRIRLPQAEIDALCLRRVQPMIASAKATFANWDSWPASAQAGVLDLMYSVGLSGFRRYVHLIAAGQRGDFIGMAAECAENSGALCYAERNEARVALFEAAAVEAAGKE